MDRLIALILSITVAILLLTTIVVFYLSFKVGPPEGLLSLIAQSIGKVFGF